MNKLFALFLLTSSFSYGQYNVENPAKRPHDWWQADWKKDSLPGISLDEAYNYLKGRKSKTVIVAVLDDCIDTSHEDLRGNIWTNKKEIPGNGIDDDHNGFIDDVHGWCFVCGKNGISQNEESPDEVRTYMAWHRQFENIDTNTLSGSLKIEYAMYQLSKKKMFDAYHFAQLSEMMESDTVRFMQYLDNLMGNYKDSMIYSIPFVSIPFSNSYDSSANIFWTVLLEKAEGHGNNLPLGYYDSLFKLPGVLNDIFFGKNIAYFTRDKYDTTKNFRLVVGDDDNDFTTKYGASTIIPQGHSDNHATLIAGIIGANRHNGIGIKGIADNVLIMPVIIGNNLTRDKDIVFAIHYAVDNGASVINLSMGGIPAIGEHVKEIMEAFDYASLHGVLIVSGAGNDGLNMDNEKYIFGQGIKGKEHNDYIRVGATTTLLNDSLVSYFSDYGEKSVDLFAPGSAIYSTAPDNKYESVDGTSFSTPVVVGVAALLKSYFPALTAVQIKKIIMKSVFKPDLMVIAPSIPDVDIKMPFSKMSKSGGIVNAYNAVKMADEMTK